MKRICTLGMAALGVASIQCAYGQSADLSKPWTVSASLRGFYDDNVNTTPSGSGFDRQDSFGFEVSPSIGIALPMEQTTITAGYRYAYKWYEERINNRDGHDSETHTFDATLRHNFNERLTLSVQDSFVVGQEPDEIRIQDRASDTPQYISGDNIRNYGSINLNAQLTSVFGLEVGYANAWFDYDDDTPGGLSSRLDRLDHAAHIDGRWYMQPETVFIVGYQFGLTDYTADQEIAGGIMSDDRNNRSHTGYLGLEHHFLETLFGTIKAGARYNDYYNAPDSQSEVSPWVQASLTYEYLPESNLQIGALHDRSATDRFSTAGNEITTDADKTVGYASIRHRIVPRLFGTASGHIQYSTFNGGAIDGDHEVYYALGVNLEYQFNRHISAEVGYNYDKVDGDNGGMDYDRNRAYIGATFTY